MMTGPIPSRGSLRYAHSGTHSAEMSMPGQPQTCVLGIPLTWAGFLEAEFPDMALLRVLPRLDVPNGLNVTVFAFLLFKSRGEVVASLTEDLGPNCLLSPKHGPSGSGVSWVEKQIPRAGKELHGKAWKV